ncbi:MAG: efflux RND transporter periplasmic adaptor subunit [Candidatus Acidiferrales bacterium]|jgi:HlyD family secretion protein
MKMWQKVGIGVGAVALAGIIVGISVHQANKNVVTVQTAVVGHEDLDSIVTASGDISALNYTNVLGQGTGLITDILVKEGDHVKKGQMLVKVDAIQPRADVDAGQAGIQAAESAVSAAAANDAAAQANVQQTTAAYQKASLDEERGKQLYQQGLIAKQDFDATQEAYDAAAAALAASKAQAQQVRAQLQEAKYALAQSQDVLKHTTDVLNKTTYLAPIDGVVTYIAVRVGEGVVPGIQNSTGSFLMTISDMSVVTSEVMVDETDIVNVRPGQTAQVSIDAIPGKTFPGHVTQVGTQAVLRTSGLTSTQSTTSNQEAKDFKVVVTLDNPPIGLRPGLSATAKITTAEKKNILAIPIQALAIRTQKELQDAAKTAGANQSEIALAASAPPQGADANETDPQKREIQGVFVVRNKKAVFVPVATGITGVSDIEVLSGLQGGDQIVTGSYKALRTLKPSSPIKVDNSAPKVESDSDQS